MSGQRSAQPRAGRGRIRLLAVPIVGALLMTACGARWDEEQRAAVVARRQGGSLEAGTGATAADGTAADLAEGAAGSPGATATDGATSAAGPGAGDAAGPAAGQPAAAAAKPCAAPSDSPGVTADELTIGSISTLSGPVPGLGASSLAAVRSYIAYRNSTGGVCGRKLALTSVDDGMDNGRYRSALLELSPKVVGLAGGIGGGDAGGVDVVQAEKLPVVNTPISTAFQNAPTVFDINPPFADVNALIGKYRYLHEQGVRKAALVYIAVDQTREEVQDKQKPQMIAAGIQIVHEAEIPLSTFSYDSAARGVANSGADYMLFVSEAGQSASMAKSIYDTGYKLKFQEYLIAYGSNFIELAGEAAEGTSSWIRSVPNEEPGTNPEQDAFLAWMGRTAPDVEPDTFAADAWAATKALVDAMDAMPGPITRDGLVAQLKSVGDYDAGGFIGPIQLGAKLNKGCFIAMKVVSGKWTRLAPSRGFLC